MIRLDEIRQSIRILEQALRDIPEGPILAGKPAIKLVSQQENLMDGWKAPKASWALCSIQWETQSGPVPCPRPNIYQPHLPEGNVHWKQDRGCGLYSRID